MPGLGTARTAGNVTSALLAGLQVVVAGVVILVSLLVVKGRRWRQEAAAESVLLGEFRKNETAVKSMFLEAYEQNQTRPNRELQQFFQRIGLNVQVQPPVPALTNRGTPLR